MMPQAETFPVTYFANFAAARKREARRTLGELADEIATTNALQKSDLPWLKLATFGDLRSHGNSLRHDNNVLAIYGIEADYDAEVMTLAEAVEKLTKAGIQALVYTSPSHTPNKPRWRVLCPLSAPCPPEKRAQYLGRLNGLFGGIFAGESWALSQSYYYGKVQDNPAHTVEIVEGEPIDLHDDLDRIWQGKPNTEQAAPGATHSGPVNEAELLADIREGRSYHTAMTRLVGKWAMSGVPLMEARRRIVETMEAIAPERRDGRWQTRFADIDRSLHDIYCKEADKKDHAAPEQDSPDYWPVVDIALASADQLPAPELPLHYVFPPRWAGWLRRAAEIKGAPVDYVAAGLLATAGGLLGNARWVSPWDGWAEPPALFVALIGNPSANKSPAIDPFQSILSAIEADENADAGERRREHATLKVAAAEKRKAWEGDVKEAVKLRHPAPQMPADADEPPCPARRRTTSTDPTVAKAERLSAANPRGLILVRDELSGWIAGMDRFANGGGSDRAFWLQTFGGRPWTPDRVKDGDAEISVPHLTWTILGGIQPDRLATVLMSGDDDGLAARFIYTWPSTRPKVSRPPPGRGLGDAKTWLSLVRSLPVEGTDPIILPLTEAAQSAFHDWRLSLPELEEGATGLFLSWLGKLPGYALRLALIFAHLEWSEGERTAPPPDIVTDRDMLRAVTFLADYAVPMAHRAFGEATLPTAERDARTLARWLLRQNPMPVDINAKELRRMRAGPGIPNAQQMDAALSELEGLGWVRRANPNRAGLGGRSRKDWIVNPKLHGRDDAMA